MANKKKNPSRLTTYMRGKLIFIFGGIICLFLALIIQIGRRVFINGDKYETIVLGQQNHTSVTLPYERGRIYDRNGNILATNEKIYTLVLEPKNIIGVTSSDEEENKTLEATVETLVQCFDIDEADLRESIEKNKDSYYLVYKKNLTYDEIKEYKEFIAKAKVSIEEDTPEDEKIEIQRARNVQGVRLDEGYKRVYPYDNLACRVLGFTSEGNNGKWGIEQYYNDTLNGTNGRSYYYFNQELTQEQTVKEAENGNSVVSTIDMQIQQIIEDKLEAFDKEVGSNVTSILVMNPQNGEILGMASSYSYNLNEPMAEEALLNLYSQEEIDAMKEYTQQVEAEEAAENESEEKTAEKAEEFTAEEGTSEEASSTEEGTSEEASSTEEKTSEEFSEEEKEDKETIYDAFYKLWRNSIISDTNEPGSTYKPFTVAAGLESGVLSGNEEYYCTGSLTVGSRNIGCSHVHGNITLKDAVAKSCNVSMMNIAFNEGAETFYQYQNLFGFGEKTGIDLPGEAETSTLVYNASNYENSATLATNAFGQNFNCTMLQMASGFCSLINGGYYYKPRIVKQIQNDAGDVVEEIEKEVLRNTISEETSETLREYLKETVETGTGTKAQIPGYSIGGKTGTAEKIPRNKEDYYISFIGFVPAEEPQLLIYVTIDEPNVDNQANAALAVNLEKECMEEILDVCGIEPTEELTEEELAAIEEQKAEEAEESGAETD